MFDIKVIIWNAQNIVQHMRAISHTHPHIYSRYLHAACALSMLRGALTVICL